MENIYLYIIQAGDYCKVGVSKHPQKRLKEVSTGCPFKPSLKYFKKVYNTTIVESKCHTLLNHLNTNGEWFKISFEECFEVVSGVIANYSKTPNMEAICEGFNIDPSKLTFEQAKSFIERTEVYEDEELINNLGVPNPRPKGWKFKVDNYLKTYYGDL